MTKIFFEMNTRIFPYRNRFLNSWLQRVSKHILEYVLRMILRENVWGVTWMTNNGKGKYNLHSSYRQPHTSFEYLYKICGNVLKSAFQDFVQLYCPTMPIDNKDNLIMDTKALSESKPIFINKSYNWLDMETPHFSNWGRELIHVLNHKKKNHIKYANKHENHTRYANDHENDKRLDT